MNNFPDTANNWMQRIAANSKNLYISEWNFENNNQVFPLRQRMSVEAHQSILGFQTSRGRVNFGCEYCYFVIQEKIDEKSLQEYMILLEELGDVDTDFTNPQHEYTFENLVILTSGSVDKTLQKMLKKFRAMKKYKTADRQYGWRTLGICIVNIENNEMLHSVYADSLSNRLSYAAQAGE